MVTQGAQHSNSTKISTGRAVMGCPFRQISQPLHCLPALTGQSCGQLIQPGYGLSQPFFVNIAHIMG
jgi:hypothetical protein